MSELLGDLTALKQRFDERNAAACPVERLILEVALQDGDKAAKQSRELLEDDNYSGDHLCAVFRRNGFKISRHSISRHRAKECSCESR